MTSYIKDFAALGYTLEIGKTKDGTAPTAKLLKNGLAKPVFFYRFANMNSLELYIAKWYVSRKEALEIKEAEKIEKQKKIAEFKNPYEVGQVLYNSWGYDQTNIDFYQVIEVKPRSILIRQIESSTVEGSGGFMSCDVVPVKDSFTGEPMRKTIQFFSNGNHYIPSKFGSFDVYDRAERGIRCSWYA